MNLTSINTLKTLLDKHCISPKKHFGQNFLVDKNIIDKIIKASDLHQNDVVVEIGSGVGVLTQELAKYVKKVIAVEKDKELSGALADILKDFNNIEIVNKDILKWEIKSLPVAKDGYKVIANPPYYITSPIIQKFLEAGILPKEMILMVQKEVAERITARPPDMSILSVAVQLYAKPKILFKVSKNSFRPSPKIDSAVIKIAEINSPLPKSGEETAFFKLVKMGFSNKRKQLIGNLARGLKVERKMVENVFDNADLSHQVRAQELSVEKWIRLLQEIEKKGIIK